MIPTSTGLEGRIAELERQVAALLAGNVLENASLALEDGTVVTTVEMAEAPVAAAGAVAAAAEATTAAASATEAAADAAAAVEAAAGDIEAAGAAAAAAQEAAAAATEAGAAAEEAASQALILVNGKSTTYVGASTPVAPDGGHRVNDEWVDTSSGAAVLRTWDGDSWEVQAWGSGALAASSVTAGQIAAGAVATVALAAEAVTAAKILSGTITASQIASGTITAGLIAAGAITTAKLAAGAVTTTELAAGAVTAAKITAGTITGTEIAAGTITAAKITGGTITAAEIASGTITGDRLAANTITADRLSATAIDGKTITGALLRTAASGARVEVDSTNGLRGIDGTGTTKTQLTTGGLLSAAGATISGTIQTAESGPRILLAQASAPAGALESSVGALSLYSESGSPASLTNNTFQTGGAKQRYVDLDAGSVVSNGYTKTGPKIRLHIAGANSSGLLQGQAMTLTAETVNIDGRLSNNSGSNWFGGLVEVGEDLHIYSPGNLIADLIAYFSGGISVTGNVAATGTIYSDGQVSIGATSPTSGEHALRRDYITTRLEGGSATFTFPAANTTYSQTVNFAVTKAAVPAVVVTAVSANPQNYSFSVGGLTNTSFTLYGRALAAGSASCRWVACSL